MSTAQILDGRALADDIKYKLRRQVVDGKLAPSLAVVLIGDDSASHLYVNLKAKACLEVGIKFHKYLLPADVTEAEVLKCIDWLNDDPEIDAILVQLPLPPQLDEDKIIGRIKPEKDADGFHPINLKAERNPIIPAPANAVAKLIRSCNTLQAECRALVISNNNIFAQAIKHLLKEYNIETHYVNPESPELDKHVRQADILISAVGKTNLIKPETIKEDAIVIDVGTNKVNDKVVGDIDFSEACHIASAITPVPGGVGPMTIACLLENVVHLHKNKNTPKGVYT